MNEQYKDIAEYVKNFGDWDLRQKDSIHGDSVLLVADNAAEKTNSVALSNQEQQLLDEEAISKIRQQIDAIG